VATDGDITGMLRDLGDGRSHAVAAELLPEVYAELRAEVEREWRFARACPHEALSTAAGGSP
jgi:hypothetical protein